MKLKMSIWVWWMRNTFVQEIYICWTCCETMIRSVSMETKLKDRLSYTLWISGTYYSRKFFVKVNYMNVQLLIMNMFHDTEHTSSLILFSKPGIVSHVILSWLDILKSECSDFWFFEICYLPSPINCKKQNWK